MKPLKHIVFTLAIVMLLNTGIDGMAQPSGGGLGKAELQTNSSPGDLVATDLNFDVETGEIRYTLSEKSLIRIRIGIKDGGPLLRTLVDWDRREKGSCLEIWDKKDSSGKVLFADRTDFLVMVTCRRTENTDTKSLSPGIRGLKKAPKFRIEFPKSEDVYKKDIPIVRGNTPVRITLDSQHKNWLTESKYELGIYIDSIYLMEDEQGTSPFTYLLDTTGMNEGIHTLTINVVSYTGEVGTRSELFFVKKSD